MARKSKSVVKSVPRTAISARTAMVRARYDAAQTTDDNRRHWVMADALSANAAHDPAIRSILRNRGRYETFNNSYALGIARTMANDVVGPGPRIQMLTDDDDLNSFIEQEFTAWQREIDHGGKLRTMRQGRLHSGEVFAVMVSNPKLAHEVKLDLQLREAEECADPTMARVLNPLADDGIFFDEFGNPTEYRLLKSHPGNLGFGLNSLDYTDVPARFVWHYFKSERPGQRRGIPEITPAIPLFAELRRYCGAVIAAAETAAEISALIKTGAPASEDGGTTEYSAMDVIELARRGGLILPEGFDATQLKAEQPTTTYNSFVDKKLAEIGRCINVPFTIAALDSSQSNLSARYLDSLIYAKVIRIDRAEFDRGNDRLFDEWLTEAIKIDGYLPSNLPDTFPHQWFWPVIDQHADPDKVASSQATRLKIGMTTLPREYAIEGLDWEEEQQNAARSLGLTIEEYQAKLRDSIFGLKQETPAPDESGTNQRQPAQANQTP